MRQNLDLSPAGRGRIARTRDPGKGFSPDPLSE
jgi:hypothetical protein